jgi:hypothetical protein
VKMTFGRSSEAFDAHACQIARTRPKGNSILAFGRPAGDTHSPPSLHESRFVAHSRQIPLTGSTVSGGPSTSRLPERGGEGSRRAGLTGYCGR